MESFWKILQSAFYFHLRLSRAKFQQEEKMSALRAAAARLCRAAILTRKTIRTRASPLCERAKTRRRQRELGNFSRQNFNHPPQNLLCQFTPQFPKISAFRAKPTSCAATIRRAAELKRRKDSGEISPVPTQRARMLSVIASAARARSPSVCAALIKQISYALGAK